MAKDKTEKKAKKEAKTVAPKPSKGDLKKGAKEKPPVISSKEILANAYGKVCNIGFPLFSFLLLYDRRVKIRK